MIEHCHDIVARPVLGIHRRVIRQVGAGIAPRAEGDATVAPGEETHLRFPASVIAGEFVNEDDCLAGAGFLVIKFDPILGGGVGHGVYSSTLFKVPASSDSVNGLTI